MSRWMIGLASIGFAFAAHGQETICATNSSALGFFGDSIWGSVSADGRYVAFVTAHNIPSAGDTDGDEDVFVFDRQNGQFELVSIDQNGEQRRWAQSTAISSDGRHVAFYAIDAGFKNIYAFVRDRTLRTTAVMNRRRDGTIVSGIGAGWGRISMSSDGRFVAFVSASDLVGDGVSGVDHVYVHDRDLDEDTVYDELGQTRVIRVSQSSSGDPGNGQCRYPHISATGRFVTFTSFASNLVNGDTNGGRDIFLHDRNADGDGVWDESGATSTERVTVTSAGLQVTGSDTTWWSTVTQDGRFVVFHSGVADLVLDDTNDLTDVFVRDRQLQTTSRVSRSADGSQSLTVSGIADVTPDGRFVTYLSWASPSSVSLVDVVVHDAHNHSRKLVSYTEEHVPSEDFRVNAPTPPRAPSSTPDGRYVCMVGRSTDMVAFSSNSTEVFLRDRGPGYLADIDGAGFVNLADLLAVIGAWGPCPAVPIPCAADLDGSASVDVADLLLVIANWSK